MHIAYLNTRYPSLSHTFIEREIRELRHIGVAVDTFSIRKPTGQGILSERHRHAADTTYYLIESVFGFVLTALAALLSPVALFRTLCAAQRIAPPGLKSRFRHVIYSIEASKLAKELRRRKLDHVHVHMANNGAAVALLATIFDRNLRYSLSIHGSAEFFRIDSWALKPKAESAAFVRCISNFCRAQVMTWTDPLAASRYHIVHCGIDVSEFTPRLPKKDSRFSVVTIGRMEAIKGYPVLLHACKKLGDVGIDWKLDMIGDGPFLPYLKTLAHELGIESRVLFPGAVGQDHIQDHINDADVMVISSFMEGIPVVLMEAMAKEVAVVATKVGGIPELINDGDDGLLVTTGSTDELAAALRKLHDYPDLLRSIGQSARRRISSQFNLRNTGTQMASLFNLYRTENRTNEAVELSTSNPSTSSAIPTTS